MGKASRSKAERWQPFKRSEIVVKPGDEGTVALLARQGFHEVWLNNRYQVLVRRSVEEPPFGRMVYLSIKRIDKEPIHDWRDLQRIKTELAGAETYGVELYPAESQVVDTSNQYHLWCFPDFVPPFGFHDGRLVWDDAGGRPPTLSATIGQGARQRPLGAPAARRT